MQVWDIQGNFKHTFRNLGIVSSVIWLGSGGRLFAGTLRNGVHELFLNTNTDSKNATRTVIHALALSPNGRYLAAGLNNGMVAITSIQETPRKVLLHHIHTAAVLSLAWSQDSTMLASGSADTTAKVWDVETEHVEHVLPHSGAVMSVAWSLNGLASGSADHDIIIWQV